MRIVIIFVCYFILAKVVRLAYTSKTIQFHAGISDRAVLLVITT
jgi:hypothetical protein